MDDSPKAVFIRELSFCLIKTALFCLVTAISNIILLVIWTTIFMRLKLTPPTVYFGFSLFSAVSALVLFLIGRNLLAFDEQSRKDYFVPVMIFIAGVAAIIIFRENFIMFFMLSWDYIFIFFVNNMGSSAVFGENNTVPLLSMVWLICCGVMTSGILFRRFSPRTKKIFMISALFLLTVMFLALNITGFIKSR